MNDHDRATALAWCEWMEASLTDAEVHLKIEIGGLREESIARVWQGQVLVDWERDDDAGGCLLRPHLVRRLVELGGRLVEETPTRLRLRGAPRVVAALGPGHAGLATGLARSPAIEVTLMRDDAGTYLGGTEEYRLAGRQGAPLMRLEARVRPRIAKADPSQPPLGRTSPSTG